MMVWHIILSIKWIQRKWGFLKCSHSAFHNIQLALYSRTFNCSAAQKHLGYSLEASLDVGSILVFLVFIIATSVICYFSLFNLVFQSLNEVSPHYSYVHCLFVFWPSSLQIFKTIAAGNLKYNFLLKFKAIFKSSNWTNARNCFWHLSGCKLSIFFPNHISMYSLYHLNCGSSAMHYLKYVS